MSEQPAIREQRVTPLELLLDLVFVFAVTQVTTLLSRDPTWGGLLRGLLLLGVLWWAWGAYAWLTNTLDPEEGVRATEVRGAAARHQERSAITNARPSGTLRPEPRPMRRFGSAITRPQARPVLMDWAEI